MGNKGSGTSVELKERVFCEECGEESSVDELEVCGDEIEFVGGYYLCPDVLCLDCRTP